MANQGNQQQLNQQQRIQQLEEVAKHYTRAAQELRNQNIRESDRHIRDAQQVIQNIRQNTAFTMPERKTTK